MLDKRIVVQEKKIKRLNCLCLKRVWKLLSIGTRQTQCLRFHIQLYLGVLMLGYLIHQHMKQLEHIIKPTVDELMNLTRKRESVQKN